MAKIRHFVRSVRTSAPDISRSARAMSGHPNSGKFYGPISVTLGARAGGKPGTWQPPTPYARQTAGPRHVLLPAGWDDGTGGPIPCCGGQVLTGGRGF